MEQAEFYDLAKRSQLGERESLGKLSELTKGKLYAYINRVTLDDDLTCDLLQETHYEMVNSIGQLKRIESFWPWLYRIATSKIQQHYRREQRHKVVQISTLEEVLLARCAGDEEITGLNKLVQKELIQSILSAMKQLKLEHRTVLALRCYEDMAYTEIAEVMNCSELSARVAFYRAKKLLQRLLSRRGIGKGSLLLALELFGRATAPANAAHSIAAGAGINQAVGPTATVLGMAGTKSGAWWAGVGIILAVFACWSFWPGRVLNRADVKTVHFISQGVTPSAGSSSTTSSAGGPYDNQALSTKGAYETWMSFPEGPDGPIIRRDQRWNIQQTQKWCSWLQDGKANYYYYSGQKKRIYITNDPLRLPFLLLPTDTPDFAEFVFEMQGGHPGIEFIRNEKNGLLAGNIDNRVAAVKNFKTEYKYNTLDEEIFLYNWPDEVEVVDQRDAMHKRGWTYFRVSGRIGDSEISGRGRMPLGYYSYKENKPWLDLQIGDKVRIVDAQGGAYVLDSSGVVLGVYPAGSVFKGLARPWMGIRTYDIVQRDAAEKRIKFESERVAEHGHVKLIIDKDYSCATIDYEIDMAREIIEKIILKVSGSTAKGIEGVVRFSYLDEVDKQEIQKEFAAPVQIKKTGKTFEEGMGVMWLFELLDGKFGARG